MIVGGGGLKSARTYEADEALLKHVVLLRDIDSALSAIEADGVMIKNDLFNIIVELD